jgi:hypothetical protein
MFNSTKEFNAAIVQILHNIKNGQEIFAELQIEESDAHDALEKAIYDGLILGVAAKRGLGNSMMISKNNPRLSYDGLQFYETHQS